VHALIVALMYVDYFGLFHVSLCVFVCLFYCWATVSALRALSSGHFEHDAHVSVVCASKEL